MKRAKTWGNRTPQQPTPEEEAKQRQPPQEARQPVTERRRMVLTSRSRTELACKVYENMGRKEAGQKMASDIASSPSIKHALYSNDYRRNRKLYDPKHITILYKHYKA